MRPSVGRSCASGLRRPTFRSQTPLQHVDHVAAARGRPPQASQWRPFSSTEQIAAKFDQTPNVPSPEWEPVYVLTLLTRSKVEATMTELRKKYYPPRRNHLPAHLTLFHALPGSKLTDTIIPTITHIAAKTSPYLINAANATSIGRGVLVHAHHLGPTNWTKLIHEEMRTAWFDFLSTQDRGKVQLHWTVMHKVQDTAKVKQAHEEILQMLKEKQASLDTWAELQGSVEGLVLWRYDKGDWKEPRQFWFQGRENLQRSRVSRDNLRRSRDGREKTYRYISLALDGRGGLKAGDTEPDTDGDAAGDRSS